MKGHIRIGGSLLLGIAVVAGAFFLRSDTALEGTGSLTVVPAPERAYIEAEDANANGVRDWEEELTSNVVKTIEPDALTSSTTAELDDTYTGKFARNFFEDYLSGKTSGAETTDKEALIRSAITSIENSTVQALFVRKDIVIVGDSDMAIREYGNHIGSIILRHSIQNENEASILSRALDAGDPEILKELVPIRIVYENMIRDSLRVPTPESHVQHHLALLNAYQAILTDILVMEQAFNDPLYTLARIKRYEEDAAGLYYALNNIHLALKASGVAYTADEGGAMFSLFEPV